MPSHSPRRKKSRCKSNQIRNPKSGRCVKKTGKIGRELSRGRRSRSISPKRLRSPSPTLKICKENQIRNPKTNRCVKVDGKIGRSILSQLEGHKPKRETVVQHILRERVHSNPDNIKDYVYKKKVMINPCPVEIVVFDFDETLTVFHSGGYPNIRDFYWGSEKNLNYVKSLIKSLQNNGIKVYIVSRSDQEKLVAYLNHYGVKTNGVFGAVPDFPVSKSRKQWAMRKADILEHITRMNDTSKQCVHFFDDDYQNIDEAYENGFENAHLIEKESRSEYLPIQQFDKELEVMYGILI